MTATVHHAAGSKEAKQELREAVIEKRGLGGNTSGSEGYGELTQGSMSKLCLLLSRLRATVLHRLSSPSNRAWPPEFDLGAQQQASKQEKQAGSSTHSHPLTPSLLPLT